MFQCEKCGEEFKFKSLLDRHLLKKKLCDNNININKIYDKKIEAINNEINEKIKLSMDDKLECFLCNSKFKSKGNTTRHMNKYCNVKKELENKIEILKNNKNKLIDKIELNKLRKDIDNLKNNNITINNTQNNLIMINSFGKEDLSHIDIKDYNKYLNGFFPGFIKFIEKIHFDEKAPENHNLCITNLRSKYISIFDNKKWLMKEKSDIIDNLLIKKYNQLSDKCEELEASNQIDKKTIENFEEFCQNYTDKEAQKATKNNVILMIYNNIDKLKNKP
jgi:hypothetical protein